MLIVPVLTPLCLAVILSISVEQADAMPRHRRVSTCTGVPSSGRSTCTGVPSSGRSMISAASTGLGEYNMTQHSNVSDHVAAGQQQACKLSNDDSGRGMSPWINITPCARNLLASADGVPRLTHGARIHPPHCSVTPIQTTVDLVMPIAAPRWEN
jgi:hypothetical protein